MIINAATGQHFINAQQHLIKFVAFPGLLSHQYALQRAASRLVLPLKRLREVAANTNVTIPAAACSDEVMSSIPA